MVNPFQKIKKSKHLWHYGQQKTIHQTPNFWRKSSSTTGTVGNKIYNLVMAFLYIRGQLGPDHWEYCSTPLFFLNEVLFFFFSFHFCFFIILATGSNPCTTLEEIKNKGWLLYITKREALYCPGGASVDHSFFPLFTSSIFSLFDNGWGLKHWFANRLWQWCRIGDLPLYFLCPYIDTYYISTIWTVYNCIRPIYISIHSRRHAAFSSIHHIAPTGQKPLLSGGHSLRLCTQKMLIRTTSKEVLIFKPFLPLLWLPCCTC